MTDLDLDAIEAREKRSTPAPWRDESGQDPLPLRVVAGADASLVCCVERPEDWDLIAPMRNALPALIAEVRRLREENHNACGAVSHVNTRQTIGCVPESQLKRAAKGADMSEQRQFETGDHVLWRGERYETMGFVPTPDERLWDLRHFRTSRMALTVPEKELTRAHMPPPACDMPPRGATVVINCDHRLRWDTPRDWLECLRCDLKLPSEALAALGLGMRGRYDRKGNAVADTATRLLDENNALLAENARLRRQIEQLERKAKR